MDYDGAIAFLDELSLYGMRLRLENIEHLLDLMGNPHRNLKCVQVAGTNGKGSTCAIISSILSAAGYRTGLYTSPHLVDVRERIKVDGGVISEEDFTTLLVYIRPLVESMSNQEIGPPTYFEVLTAAALKYFSDQGVDFAVLEVGLGGRLDATSVVNPLVSVVTNVELDHTKVLGDSFTDIAREKASIIRESGLVVSGESKKESADVINTECDRKNARLFQLGVDFNYRSLESSVRGQRFNYSGVETKVDNAFIPLVGSHQLMNASVALAAVECLMGKGFPVSVEAVKEGLSKVVWQGRMQVLGGKPFLVMDGAHNPSGIQQLIKSLDSFSYDRLFLVFGVSSTKDYSRMLSLLAPLCDGVIATRSRGKSALDPELIKNELLQYLPLEKINVVPNPASAIQQALNQATEKDLILVTGSLYLIAEVMPKLLREAKSQRKS